MCRLPEQIPPAQQPLPFGPQKLRVSAPQSLLATVTGTLGLWGVSHAAGDPPRVTCALPTSSTRAAGNRTWFSARSRDEARLRLRFLRQGMSHMLISLHSGWGEEGQQL